eukprot:1986874-Rhodomonas_salina.2
MLVMLEGLILNADASSTSCMIHPSTFTLHPSFSILHLPSFLHPDVVAGANAGQGAAAGSRASALSAPCAEPTSIRAARAKDRMTDSVPPVTRCQVIVSNPTGQQHVFP